MHTLVKICGVTTPEDAREAAAAGADLVGLVLHRGSRRWVPEDEAAEVVAAARGCGVQPVGVFVEEDAAAIAAVAAGLGLEMVQLHGRGARLAAGALPPGLRLVVALEVGVGGAVEAVPAGLDPARHLLLCDTPGGGSGRRFDWGGFRAPAGFAWMLAGGLDPGNVCKALRCLRPAGVDVSSGVCGADPRRKDAVRMRRFVQRVRAWDAQHATA